MSVIFTDPLPHFLEQNELPEASLV